MIIALEAEIGAQLRMGELTAETHSGLSFTTKI